MSQFCEAANCTKKASFGIVGNKPITCKDHKAAEHVNLKHKRCIHSGCLKTASFGINKTALYCSTHKEKHHTDVRHEHCEYPGCNKRPSYGINGKATHCFQHKKIDHANMRHKRCSFSDCKTRASFGIPGYTPEYCGKHKKHNMVSRHKKIKAEKQQCTFCCADVHYTEQFCSSCKTYIIDGKTVRSKQKELEIKTILDDSKILYSHDITIKDGCSKKRPDFVILTTWGNIILEVDEHQHNRKTYTCECELTRMKQLCHDVGVENLLFIRYNPDTYKTFSDDKPMSKKARKDYLIKYLNKYIDGSFEKFGVVYMFYDGFIPSNAEIEKIDPYT